MKPFRGQSLCILCVFLYVTFICEFFLQKEKVKRIYCKLNEQLIQVVEVYGFGLNYQMIYGQGKIVANM